MTRFFPAFLFLALFTLSLGLAGSIAQAQQATSASLEHSAEPHASAFSAALKANAAHIIKGSVKTAQSVIDAIQETGSPAADMFLDLWQNKDVWYRKKDKALFTVKKKDSKTYTLFDPESGDPVGTASKKEIKQIKPNSGVRAMVGAALVANQLVSEDVELRKASLDSLARDPKPSHLLPLRRAVSRETDEGLKRSMIRLERLLTTQYDKDEKARVAAIRSFASDLGLDVRARLNPILASRIVVEKTEREDEGTARRVYAGSDEHLSVTQAYDMLVAKGWASADISPDQKYDTLVANIKDGQVGGLPVASLNEPEARHTAYKALVEAGLAPHDPSDEEVAAAVANAAFYAVYDEPSEAVIKATQETLASIETRVSLSEFADLFLDGLSLASIFFLAAIGLAITFGVMGVINMAHGEFIMMGAYTGYLVQQYITNYTLSIIVAIPAAFVVTFAAGVALERLVIRHLYHRPLETLLATFGVSIALQQLAKNIFGTQARPLTSPEWLDGALVINDVISISWIRVAIFALSLIFFAMLWFILNRTRLGLETRAVTQNPRMAASMGINPNKINMLTFGLGSGIAGIAGVAIGLFAKVTSELGSDYIVQSFMTVVVGGVGNIWGTLAGAAMIGFLQKGIEWFNPSNTLAAQTFMIIFIIIFIQFRPRGIIALKGRAAGD
ncbi:urea ABC transporter permease subunit UrtB [uncultured Cohaesibacter sp.]|uniref:urea ABC transporter permease subunit UrtB n=1 Tax=uncultured Cohaesibacter sp. TaxID=1002546 RepID=UPI00292E8215|nr:urea ABC transporter permease subunit UrtB [uncultured Cohaesibacter sp.]